MIERAVERFLVLGPVALLALGLSLALMVLLRPWLSHYALARPNARSSGTWLPMKRSAKCSIGWHGIWIN